MNRVPTARRVQIVKCLVESTPLRGIERITGTDVNTIMWLMVDLGQACQAYHDKNVRKVNVTRIECDELFAFVHTKDAQLKPSVRHQENRGSFYTWIAIDPVTKLIPSWHVGRRESADAEIFISDLWSRVNGRIQLCTDGFKAYQPAIENSFGTDVDYGQLLKIFDDALEKLSAKEFFLLREQPRMKATKKLSKIGNPDSDTMGTSIIERYNLTIRMSLRRYARCTNGFSKKFENHVAATSLWHHYYNFCRIHSTIRCTPAMEAGLSDHIWEVEELLALLK